MAARTPIPLAPVSAPSIQLDAWARDTGRVSEIDRIGGAEDVELMDVRTTTPGDSDGGAVVRPIPSKEVANVGIGAAADAESTSGSGSIIAILKRLRTLLNGGLPALVGGALPVNASGVTLTVSGTVGVDSLPNEGQQVMANSVSVTLASDQTAVVVSDGAGALTVDAVNLDIRDLSSATDSVAVTDGGGTLTVDDGGSSLTVDGTVAISGTVTVSVSGTTTVDGTVSTKTDLLGDAPGTDTVGTTEASLVASTATRKGFEVFNTSEDSQKLWLAFDGQPAIAGSGVPLEAGDGWAMDEFSFSTGEIRWVGSAADTTCAFQEFLQ